MRQEVMNLSDYPINMNMLGMNANGLIPRLRNWFKGIVKEALEEIIEERNYSRITETPLLTTEELCKRWNITPDTLHNWEKKGKITKMPLGGRKKMYSLQDIEEAEAMLQKLKNSTPQQLGLEEEEAMMRMKKK